MTSNKYAMKENVTNDSKDVDVFVDAVAEQLLLFGIIWTPTTMPRFLICRNEGRINKHEYDGWNKEVHRKKIFVILYELEDYYQNLGNLQDIAEVIFDDEDDMPDVPPRQW